ncbi:hypothetical protein Tco_1103579 [Tanacetum coccineum]
MASLDHRLKPLFSIKECMTCGALYTADFCCSKGGLEDKILVPKPPQNCATCGNPVDGLYCRHCVFVRKCLNEGWYTIHDENEILNTSKSSKNNTNVVSAPQEPFVFNQDPGVNSSQSPLQINHNCCYKCGDLLDGIFCQQCTCKSCGNGAHIGYNCPPKAPIISNSEQCNQTIAELPQTLPSVHPTCNYEDENSFTYDSKPNSFNDSLSVIIPSHPQLQFEGLTLFLVKYPPQRTVWKFYKLMRLNGCKTSFLKEYDHIPPNEKCMALMLAEERFLKIKQILIEEHNQPIIRRTVAQSFTPYWDVSMIDDEEARDNFLKDVCTFLRKFSRIPFGVTPKVILIAWESFGEIKDALMDKQYRQEDIQELMSKLLEDVQNISQEPKAITPDEPSEEPEDPLIMGEKELSTIPEKDKSSVEDLVPIPSGSKGVSDDIYDHSDAESLPSIQVLRVYENIEYVEASPLNLEYDSLEEENEDQEEKEFDLEDIFQIQDVILRERLLNIHRLITNIESLKNNPTPDFVFKSPSSFSIPVVDSDSFFEESDTSLSHLDNSLPKFETFSDHTEETRSGSITTHANNLLSRIDLFERPEFDHYNFDL